MVIINLRDFYPWYTHDEFIEVPIAVAKELFADRRYEPGHWRRLRRNKAQYSLDAGDGIEREVCFGNLSPHELFERLLLRCEVCKALNSLPETQGRRVDAYYILGKTYRAIAKDEGVDESSVRASVSKGILTMQEILRDLI